MKTKYIFLALAALALASCNDYDVINKEQYKHVFAFISDADHINGKVFSLDSLNEQGYFSISMGGSTATDKDLTVNLVEDPEVLSGERPSGWMVTGTTPRLSPAFTTHFKDEIS